MTNRNEKLACHIRDEIEILSLCTLPGSGQQITNADDSTTRSSQGGLMSMLNQKSADLNYNTMRSTDSLTSSQQNQLEFIQDNIDYQWFLDYGYRDGSSSLQRSSILSASCYDDLARDLDANLAHVDMEDFNHEDIHSLLHSLPPMCVRDIQERQGEMFASVSRSLLTSSSSKFPFSSSPSTSPLSSTEDPALSLVKSGPLFSPVKECSLPPAGTYSVDSLDCDEMMITCQHPNKHNYTIAFQGSTMMTSDTNESSDDNSKSQGCGVGGVTQPDKPKPKWMSELRGSGVSNPEMSNSDSPLTTWSKMKPTGGDGMLSRVPSGNNNSTPIGQTFDNTVLEFKPLQSACSVPSLLQSQSLPNLVSNKHQQWLLRNKLLALNSSINAAEKAFDVPIKIFDIEQSSSINSITDSIFSSSVVNSPRHSVASTPPPELSSNQNAPKKHTTTPSHQPNFSLLKLFIKQKNNLDNSVAATTHSVANNNNNENYMSWNEEGDTGAPCGEITNVNKCNVATWNTRPGGQNLNKQNYLATQHNGNYSFDSLTTATLENKMAEEDEGRVDNEEHLSVSQTSAGGSCYCDCGAGGHGPALSESTDSFSSHTNRPTVRAASAGPGGSSAGQSSQDTLSKDTESVAGRRMWHRAQCPMFDKSMQTSARNISASTNKTQSRSDASGGGGGKQVYVLYPNYTLPDLSFLQDHATELDLNNVFLWPQKFEPSPVCEQAPPLVCKETSGASRGRPMSCVDIDTLKRKGFSHVKDWSSLIYLLPREYTRILSDLPEIEAHLKSDAHLLEEVPVPLFCSKKRPVSCGDESTSSSNAPSSGYRGSSSILNEEAPSNNPLFIYRYDSISSESSMLQQTPPQLPKRQHSLSTNTDEGAPPRPPLPRSILRHPPHLEENIAKLKHGSKRFSMFEFGSKEDLAYDAASQPTTTTTHQQQVNKRASLPSNFINKKEGGGDHVWEDEGVEVGGTDSTISSEQVEDPAQRLEHLLEESGGPESWQKEDITTLRAQKRNP
ncbi:hypothetical protein M8J75_010208 [Diaphorina citri]|nr:hypothetical protein M8J75_010208 [Diaphorina citri]